MEKLFAPKRERGRVIQNLRVVVDYRVKPEGFHISRSEKGGVIVWQWWDETVDDSDTPYVDSEALRDAFFKVSSPDQAEAFLKASGPFRASEGAIEVSWPNFQLWQAYFKKQMRLTSIGKGWGAPPEVGDPEELDRVVRMPVFQPLKSEQPVLAATANSAVDCIAAANYLDRWAQAVVMSCRQCADPFKPSTKAAIFCGNPCARAHWRANGKMGVRKGGGDAGK